MVFKSLLADLINRALGDYIVDLDRDQLKTNIWAGRISLNDLILKPTIFEDLNLPVVITYGQIGTLKLNVPWTNIYKSPVVGEVTDLVICCKPLNVFPCGDERKKAQNKKMADLARIEAKTEPESKPEHPPGYVEMIFLQIIKNIQLTVKNVHIRYEDTTNSSNPMALGVTLEEVFVRTVDQNWKEAIITETSFIFNKLAAVRSLAVYCDVNPGKLVVDRSPWEIKDFLLQNMKIGMNYVLSPLSMEVRLEVDMRPSDNDFRQPKVSGHIRLGKFELTFQRSQYVSVMQIHESFTVMQRSCLYRKYKPPGDLKGNYRLMWDYVITAVLETQVKPRKRTFSQMCAYFRTFKNYVNLYDRVLTEGNVPGETRESLELCENQLDLFCLALARKIARKRHLKSVKRKSWFGRIGSLFSADEDQNDFSEEERLKLNEAIGYNQDFADSSQYPPEFVAYKLSLDLQFFSFQIKPDESPYKPIFFNFYNLHAVTSYRPSASAVRVVVSLVSFGVSHINDKGQNYKFMENSQSREKKAVFDGEFETNPLHRDCSAYLRIKTQPITVTYTKYIVRDFVQFFSFPNSIALEEYQMGTIDKLRDLKDKSHMGIVSIIQTKKFAYVLMDFEAIKVIIPDSGDYFNYSSLIVADSGKLVISSHQSERSDNADIRALIYDHYSAHFHQMQVVLTESGGSSLLLHPLSLELKIDNCTLSDPQYPKIVLDAHLSWINISLNDDKMARLLAFSEALPSCAVDSNFASPPRDNMNEYQMVKLLHRKPSEMPSQQESQNLFQLRVTIQRVGLAVRIGAQDMSLVLGNMSCDLSKHSFATTFNFSIASLSVDRLLGNDATDVIVSSIGDNKMESLLRLRVVMADVGSPRFVEDYGGVRQSISVCLTTFNVCLDEPLFVDVLQFISSFHPQSTAVPAQESIPLSLKDIQFIAQIDFIFFEITTSEQERLMICLKNMSTMVESFEGVKTIKFEIGEVSVDSCLMECSYRHFLMTEKEGKVAQGTVVARNREKIMEFDVTVGKIRIAYLSQVLVPIWTFLDHLKILNDAPPTAIIGEKLTTVVHKSADLLKQQTRIKLNFDVNAPQLILPRSYSSTDTVLLDFGHLSITNTYDHDSVNHVSVVIDSVSLQRKQLVDGDLDIYTLMCDLVSPISATLEVARPPSGEFTRILGRVPQLRVEASRSDYICFLDVLENLTSPASTEATSVDTKNNISLAIDVDAIQLVIYHNETLQDDFTKHFKNNTFGLFNVSRLRVEFGDKTSLDIGDMTIRDIRPNNSLMFNRTIFAKQRASSDFITSSFARDQSTSVVSVKVAPFIMAFDLPYVYTIVYIVSPPAKKIESDSLSNQIGLSPPNADRPVTHIQIESSAEIILLESEDKNTGFLLKSLFSLKGTMSSESSQLDVKLAEAQVFAGIYKEGCDFESTILMVSPVSVLLSRITHEARSELNIKFSPVTINLFPAVINSILAALTLISSKNGDQAKRESTCPKETNWSPQKLIPNSFPFLTTNKMTRSTRKATQDIEFDHTINLSVDSIVVNTFSQKVGNVYPLITLNASFMGRVMSFLTDMRVESTLTLVAAVYNSNNLLWEPLVEPTHESHIPWKVSLKYRSDDSRSSFELLSNDRLELTVTNNSLGVLSDLIGEFNSAHLLESITKTAENPSFLLRNESGLAIQIGYDPRMTDMLGNSGAVLGPGQSIGLRLSDSPLHDVTDLLAGINHGGDYTLSVSIVGFVQTFQFEVTSSSFEFTDSGGRNSTLVVHVEHSSSGRVLRFTSTVEFYNHLSDDMVCLFDDSLYVTVLSHSRCPLPLPTVLSANSVSFMLRQTNLDNRGHERFAFSAVMCSDQVIVDSRPDKMYMKFDVVSEGFLSVLHIWPLLVIENCLPYSIEVSSKGLHESHLVIEPRMRRDIRSVTYGEQVDMVVVNYLGRNWGRSRLLMKKDVQGEEYVEFINSADSLYLGIVVENSTWKIFCPYWLVNKTGLTLTYKLQLKTTCSCGDEAKLEIVHECADHEYLLLCPGEMARDKVRVRAEGGSWSDSYRLDIPSSCATRLLKARRQQHLIVFNNYLTDFPPTKIVLITPFYLVCNKSSYPLYVYGPKLGDLPLFVDTESCAPIWPESPSKAVYVRFGLQSDIGVTSEVCRIADSRSFALKLGPNQPMIVVSCSATESSLTAFISDFSMERSAFCLINGSMMTVSFLQEGVIRQMESLDSRSYVYSVWPDPQREFVINFVVSNGFTFSASDVEDQLKTFEVNGFVTYFVSFLDGILRIFLFTHDHDLATHLHNTTEVDDPNLSFTLALSSIGVSYVDNKSKVELLYLSVDHSEPSWHSTKNTKLPKLDGKTSKVLEEARKNGEIVPSKHDANSATFVYEQVEVVRRATPGLHLVYCRSDHVCHGHLRVFDLQLDCQQPRANYNVILAPMRAHKSFIEASFLVRNSDSRVLQVMYGGVLLQEFVANVDLLFIMELLHSLYSGDKAESISQETIDYYKNTLFHLSMTRNPSNAALYYFDLVHISPLKFSLSLKVDNIRKFPDGLNYLLSVVQGLFSSLIGVTSLPIRIGFFEKKSSVFSLNGLLKSLADHFIAQLVRQFYAVLLGTDVLGNPYGLIHNLSTGITDLFYDPIHGAIQGPEEFSRGLVTGAQSFIGNVVGGTAASFSLLFGFSGQLLSYVTFDEIYVRKTILAQKRAITPLAAFNFGLKEFLGGILCGAFGLFIKPVQYGRIEGWRGVVKGVGIGIVAVPVRPLLGTVHLLASIFEMFKLLFHPAAQIHSLRFRRVIADNGQIAVYSRQEAELKYIFDTTSDDREELIHSGLTQCNRMCFLTTRRIFVIKLSRLNEIKVCWDVPLGDIISMPTLTERGVLFHTRAACGTKRHQLQMRDEAAFFDIFCSLFND